MEDAISSYSGKEVEVNVTIDPSIIGGIVTRIGSMVIDGSIQNSIKSNTTIYYKKADRGYEYQSRRNQ